MKEHYDSFKEACIEVSIRTAAKHIGATLEGLVLTTIPKGQLGRLISYLDVLLGKEVPYMNGKFKGQTFYGLQEKTPKELLGIGDSQWSSLKEYREKTLNLTHLKNYIMKKEGLTWTRKQYQEPEAA